MFNIPYERILKCTEGKIYKWTYKMLFTDPVDH